MNKFDKSNINAISRYLFVSKSLQGYVHDMAAAMEGRLLDTLVFSRMQWM
jgi:hypothetical protein